MSQPGYPAPQDPYGQQYGQPYGQQPYGGAAAPQINNNLAISIVGLLLFWPVGLFGLINATKVSGLAAQGDYAGAQAAADQAKKFGKIAIIVGACLYGLSILLVCGLFLLAALAGGASTTTY